MHVYMMKLAMGVLVTIGLTLALGTAEAKSIEVPKHGQTTAVFDFGPATIWVDEQGVQHVRGALYYEEFVGEAGGFPYTGAAVGVFNWNLDLQTYNGDGQARTTYTSHWGNLSGTTEGNVDLIITAGVFEGTWNWSQCTGDFEGMHMRGTIVGDLASAIGIVDGIIHIPSGEGGLPSGSPVNDGEPSTWGAVKATYR
jgi:hypothetical protein